MEVISNKASRSIYFCSIILVIVSFFIRFEYIDTLRIENPIMKDAYYYYTCAYNLAKYNIFSSEPVFNSDQIPKPDSFLAPGFPYLLSSAIKLSAITQVNFNNTALLYNAVLGALIAPMVFYICIQFMPLFLAIVTSLITIFSPHLISIGGYLLTETLFCFLLMSSIVCLIVGVKNKSLFFYSLSGFLIGLSYLTNPVIFFLPFIIACFIPFVKISELDNIGLKIRSSVVYFLIFLFVSGCWEYRNYISVDKQAKSSKSRAVINLMNGLYPDYLDTFRKGQTRDPDYPMNKDIERANSSLKKSIVIISEKVFEEPCKYLKWYLIEKPFIFWSWDIHIGTGDIYVYPVRQSLFTTSKLWKNIKHIFQLLNSILIFINFVGLGLLLISARSGRRGIYELLCVIISFYATAIYSIFYPDPRYSIPFRPFFYIFFIWTLHIIINETKCFFGHRNVR